MKKIRRIRQLIPTKFATVSKHVTLPNGQRRYQVDIKLNMDAHYVAEAHRVVMDLTRDYCGVIGEPVDVTERVIHPEFVRWWMWFGRCFKVRRTAI
jgi:hypothetical protein